MGHRLRAYAVGLTLAAATITATTLTATAAHADDTTASTQDTTPTTDTGLGEAPVQPTRPVITPLDTYWG